MYTQQGWYCSCTTAFLILQTGDPEHTLRIKGFNGPIPAWHWNALQFLASRLTSVEHHFLLQKDHNRFCHTGVLYCLDRMALWKYVLSFQGNIINMLLLSHLWPYGVAAKRTSGFQFAKFPLSKLSPDSLLLLLLTI